MKDSNLVDMVVFRENTEDIYAGIEYPTGSQEVQKLIKFCKRNCTLPRSDFRRVRGSASNRCPGKARKDWFEKRFSIVSSVISVQSPSYTKATS